MKTMEYTVRDIQLKQLEILHELDRVCKIADVQYYLAAGTCLGALRHEGFIPWDDDIDVFMHWEELERLLEKRELFGEQYFLQCSETEPNINTVLCRLRDAKTTCITPEDADIDINHGVFIDIYVLYPYPDNPILAQKLIYDSFILRILQAKRGPQNHGKLAQVIGNTIARLYTEKGREKKIKKIIDEYKNNKGNKYYSIYFGEDIKLFWARKYPVKWFMTPHFIQFEDLKAPCPTDTLEYCKYRYGENCMELPPPEKRITNHDFIKLDLQNPYE